MTNEEKINRLMNIQRCTPIHTRDDSRDFEALEAAIEAIKILDKIESRLGIALKESEEESLAINRLIAVSGMSIEDLANAFTKGYSLVSQEWLKELKELREQTRWIPVTERLPDDHGRYLISTDDGMVEIVNYGDTNDLPNEITFHQWDDEEWQCWKPNVTAWMPLPKAYKAENERVRNETY